MVKKNKDLVKKLIKISNYYGQRYDLIQAAGGNSSIKFGNKMLIKSSGYSLAELSYENGYSEVDNKILLKYLNSVKDKEIHIKDENRSFNILSKSLHSGSNPSIETLAHSILKKYTIHLHPLACNMMSVQASSRELFKKIFKSDISKNNIFYINYKTPGIALAQEIYNILNGKVPRAISCGFILENHGLICTSSSINGLFNFTEYITNKIEKYLKLDFNDYKQTTIISKNLEIIGYKNLSVTLCEDYKINSFLKKNNLSKVKKPLNPDSLLYCGIDILNVNSNIKKNLMNFYKKYNNYPRVIYFKKKIFFVSENILKAKEIEDVFKSHLYLYSQNNVKRALSKENIKRLESYNPQKNRLRFWFDYAGKIKK
tara:strand:+ start:1655 stop:2767 length:1113 start_codon:yes stop_codon:yes gene_type:complete